MTTSRDEFLPRPLGPYLLLARVGRGGMGDVYLAKHGQLLGFEKHCVLKMLRDDRADDDQLLARFADEARVVVQLSHRNICPVFDVGRVGSRLYVALEYVVGRDLRTIAAAGPIPTAIALHIVGEVLEALDYAHRFVDVKSGAPLGIVHRDVSPHNVLLGVDGDTKLIDFGIATTRGTSTSDGDAVLGKLGYMSPEHARGEVVDGRSDQFAAAIMLAELLLGERFYQGLSQQQVWERVGGGTHRPSRWGSLDVPLRMVLDRALAPAAAKRFETCADFADALSRWARSAGHVAAPREVRRHLQATCGDLAAEHRRLLCDVDATLARLQDRPAVLQPGQARCDDDDDQFESIATTLAAPPQTQTPHFAAFPPTALVDRSRRPVANSAAVSSSLAPLPTTVATPAVSNRLAIVGALLGLAVGVVATAAAVSVLARPADVDVEVVDVDVVAATDVDPTKPVGPPAVDAGAAIAVAAGVPDAGADAGADADADAGAAGAAVDVDTRAALRPRTTPPRPPRPLPPPAAGPGFDVATRGNLSSLQRCVDKVPCARGILEWSRQRGLSAVERDQVKASASDCAQRCRLK